VRLLAKGLHTPAPPMSATGGLRRRARRAVAREHGSDGRCTLRDLVPTSRCGDRAPPGPTAPLARGGLVFVCGQALEREWTVGGRVRCAASCWTRTRSRFRASSSGS
jgi:hypothetical protein